MSQPSTGWKEVVPADEEARFARYASELAALTAANAQSGIRGRALHHKGVGGFAASLEILERLPPHAQHGLFARPGRYDAWVRFSNGASRVQRDGAGDVRGIAVKVLGVLGPKVLGDARTQDFLGILSSATPFRSADDFARMVLAVQNPALAPFRVFGALGFRGLGLLGKMLAGIREPLPTLATRRFFSALPIQCGPYAARFAFTPIGARDPGGPVPAEPPPNYLGDDLVARLRVAPLEYSMELQFFVDEARTPIEDASVDWPEDVSPWVFVGKLVLPKQDGRSDEGRALAQRIEKAAFDPWHALVEHKPLGNMMRARRHAYFASTTARGVEPEP
jgi:hypothetical protein